MESYQKAAVWVEQKRTIERIAKYLCKHGKIFQDQVKLSYWQNRVKTTGVLIFGAPKI